VPQPVCATVLNVEGCIEAGPGVMIDSIAKFSGQIEKNCSGSGLAARLSTSFINEKSNAAHAVMREAIMSNARSGVDVVDM
jgi:hypothetical protein